MENASKALLMAAGMLMTVLIASVLVLMFSTMSEYTKAYDERKQTEELQAFNGQFEKYVEEGATAQDVVTVINKVKSYNQKNDGNMEVYVEEKIVGFAEKKIDFTISEEIFNNNLNIFLRDRSHDKDVDDSNKYKMIKYSVTIGYQNGIVSKITFIQDGFFE